MLANSEQLSQSGYVLLSEEPLSITLHEVTHRYGSRPVFANVNASVESGQVLVVRGANGAGKSTLLRIIAGLLAPASGKVGMVVGGREIRREERREWIGYVAPDLTLYRDLTGVENLLFFARLRGGTLSHEDLKRRLDQVGLLGRGRDRVSAYSSGMRQRLKYAFALLHDPPILLLDEPTANLDVDGIAMVERVVAAQKARPGGGLVIVATNEPCEETWGDHQVALQAEA